MPAIAQLILHAKVIARVHDVSWVVDSIDKLAHSNVSNSISIFA